MELSLENADLVMKIQAGLQKKTLDQQANNIKKLVESAAQLQDEIKKREGGISSSGRVDLLA